MVFLLQREQTKGKNVYCWGLSQTELSSSNLTLNGAEEKHTKQSVKDNRCTNGWVSMCFTPPRCLPCVDDNTPSVTSIDAKVATLFMQDWRRRSPSHWYVKKHANQYNDKPPTQTHQQWSISVCPGCDFWCICWVKVNSRKVLEFSLWSDFNKKNNQTKAKSSWINGNNLTKTNTHTLSPHLL